MQNQICLLVDIKGLLQLECPVQKEKRDCTAPINISYARSITSLAQKEYGLKLKD
jgi:hypothetical protein